MPNHGAVTDAVQICPGCRLLRGYVESRGHGKMLFLLNPLKASTTSKLPLGNDDAKNILISKTGAADY